MLLNLCTCKSTKIQQHWREYYWCWWNEKGVLEDTTRCKGEFISPIFFRRKKDGIYRLILNLKEFNEKFEYHHFKWKAYSQSLTWQTCYPRLMSMLIQLPRLLQRKENLLRLPHSQKCHPLWKKMQLMACLVSGIASRQKEFQKKQEESWCSHGEKLPGSSMAIFSKSRQYFLVKGTFIYRAYLYAMWLPWIARNSPSRTVWAAAFTNEHGSSFPGSTTCRPGFTVGGLGFK